MVSLHWIRHHYERTTWASWISNAKMPTLVWRGIKTRRFARDSYLPFIFVTWIQRFTGPKCLQSFLPSPTNWVPFWKFLTYTCLPVCSFTLPRNIVLIHSHHFIAMAHEWSCMPACAMDPGTKLRFRRRQWSFYRSMCSSFRLAIYSLVVLTFLGFLCSWSRQLLTYQSFECTFSSE